MVHESGGANNMRPLSLGPQTEKIQKIVIDYEFDTRYQSGHIRPQPIQLNFMFSAAVANIKCHALVLTIQVIIVSRGIK